MNLEVIKKIAQAEFSEKRSSPYNEKGDKYTHGERVAKIAVQLRQLILPNNCEYDDILTIAAWFHDVCICIGDDRKDHCISGAKRTHELLTKHCTIDELEQICGIIAVHDDRNPSNNNYSNVIKIHQDADHLDHFGAIGIWRFVAYSIGNGSTINDAAQMIQGNRAKYVAEWSQEFNFHLSKKIFDDKMQFEDLFFKRFLLECDGNVYGGE